jgi:FkbM family methyltransferase
MISRRRLIAIAAVVFILVSLYESSVYYVHVRTLWKDVVWFSVLRHLFADPSAGGVFSLLPPLDVSDDASRPHCIVDVGAHDGVFQSNSFFAIRSRGWRGFLFELDPVLCARAAAVHEDWPSVRVVCAGLSNRTEITTFRQITVGLQNSLETSRRQYDPKLGFHERAAVVLDASIVCEELARFNCSQRILSIDVEGHEHVILPRINCRFDVIILEGTLWRADGLVGRNCTLLFKAHYNNVYRCVTDRPQF